MTREEKIAELINIRDNFNYTLAPREVFDDAIKALEQEPILDKIKSDIAKFADTIPFVSGDIKAKYTNIGQHDGLEQALEIIEGNLKGDFDIDEWMAESE